MTRGNTREDILGVAAQQFAHTGFKGTSLHDIAVRVGCSKATLLYHFDSKDAILTALLAPAMRELTALDTRLRTLDTDAAREAAIEGFVDLVLTYRREVALIYGDLPRLLDQPTFRNLRSLTENLIDVCAGRSTEPTARIAAEVLLAGISSIVIDRTEDGDTALRPALVAVARRVLLADR